MSGEGNNSIQLGLPEFHADDILKAQITDNIFAIHRVIEHMDPHSTRNLQYLIECFMTSLTPFKKQQAVFDLRDKMITEQLEGVVGTDEKNEVIIAVHMRIFGLCRELYAQKYGESRLAVMY